MRGVRERVAVVTKPPTVWAARSRCCSRARRARRAGHLNAAGLDKTAAAITAAGGAAVAVAEISPRKRRPTGSIATCVEARFGRIDIL